MLFSIEVHRFFIKGNKFFLIKFLSCVSSTLVISSIYDMEFFLEYAIISSFLIFNNGLNKITLFITVILLIADMPLIDDPLNILIKKVSI